MKRVTLNGIKRIGLVNWKAREWWIERTVRIWSAEHRAFWLPNGTGYTEFGAKAGTWAFPDAYEEVKHCGTEKKIVFYAVAITVGK